MTFFALPAAKWKKITASSKEIWQSQLVATAVVVGQFVRNFY